MALTHKNLLQFYIKPNGVKMDKELELAVDNPQEFLAKPQPNREWDMSIEDIARSVNYNPYKSLATKAMVEPKRYNWVSSVLAGIGSSVDSILSNSAQATDDMLGMYYSPNMTQEQADRLTEDVIYARNFAYKAKQAEDYAYAKDHPEAFEFSQGIGSFIAFVLGELASPLLNTYLMFSSSKGQMAEQLADKFIETTGDIRGYAERKKTDDMLSTGFAALNTYIERAMGMEKILGRFIRNPAKYGKIDYFKAARSQLTKQTLLKTAERAAKGFIQEGVLEEAPQSYLEDATQILAGYGAWEDLLSKESFRKAARSAWIGGIIGAGAGATMFNVSRIRVKRDIAQWAQEHNVKLSDLQITQAADTFINKGQEALLSDLTTRAELKTKNGKAFEILVEKVKQQIEGTGQPLPEGQDLDEFARVVARTIQIPSQNLSLWSNIPVEDYLNAANIRVINGMWELEPLQTSQEVKSLIDQQKAIIKEQNALKKLGTENERILENARRRKNELQVIYDYLVGQETMEEVKTFRKKQQIDYVKAKDLLPEQTRSIEGVKEATDEEDFVVFAGKKIPVSYEVVELDSIQPSHIDGEVNKNYTNKELQNRASRGTTIDMADLRNKAKDFTPELVLTAPTSAQGAPITNAKGEVIAGNGRAEIIRLAYAENPEGVEKYKKALEKLGFNISGMKQPILIRRNTTMNEEQQISAADISNIQEASAFDAASRAKQDSKYLKDSPSITDFASKLPMSERRGLMLNDGTWNTRAVRQRYEEALLSWLCGNDTKLYERLVLKEELPQKVIDPLVDNGSAIVDLQEKYPDLDIRADVYGALVKYQRTNRGNFTSVMQEQELNGRDVMPENVVLWNFIFNNNTTIKMFFDNYTKTAMDNREAVNAGEDMFGQRVAPLSKKDLYAQALKKTDEMRSQIATESKKKYDPLFTETGEITDVNLQSAFISYQNQFNNPNNSGVLFQTGYASMRGELIGESLDADAFAGKGEGSSVWFWGNYLLANKELDKENYYDMFRHGGPKLTYDGKELNHYLLNNMGITFKETQNIIANRLGDLSLTKDWLVKTLTTNLRNSESIYEDNVNDVVKLVDLDNAFAYKEEEIRDVIKDIEKILLGKGWNVGALWAFPEDTEEGKIQAKYFKDAKKKELFDNVYSRLLRVFGEKDYLTNFSSNYAVVLADLESQRKSLKAIDNFDFDKLGGRTGMLFKGQNVEFVLDRIDMPFERWRVADKIKQTISEAIVKNKDVVKAINSIKDKPYINENKLKKDIDKLIAKKTKSESPAFIERIKSAFDMFLNSEDIGESQERIMNKLSLTEGEKEFVNDILTDMEGHDYLVDKSNTWHPSMADIFFSIRSKKNYERGLEKVKEVFKGAKNSDFVYKPNASMYSFEVPKDELFLSAKTALDKQTPFVKNALVNFIKDFKDTLPFLKHYIDVPNMNYDSLRWLFLLDNNINGDFDDARILDIKNNIVKSASFKSNRNYIETKLLNLMHDAVKGAVIETFGRKTTMQDIVNEIDVAVMLENPHVNSGVIQEEYEDVKRLGKVLKDNLLTKFKPTDYLEDASSYLSEAGLSGDSTGKRMYDDIVNNLVIHPEVFNELKQDELLGLTEKPTPAEMASKLLRKYGIAGGRYYGKRDKKGWVTFDKTPVKERLLQAPINQEKDLFATHAVRLDGLKQALKVGGFAMPSFAIDKNISGLTGYGDIVFVAPADMVKPSRTTKVYDRDAWTPMINFIEYSAKEGFYDRVKEILEERGVDPKSTSTYVYNIEEKMKEGFAVWNTSAIELYGIAKGYIKPGEMDEMRSIIQENPDIQKDYEEWYDEFIFSNMTPRIFRGYTELGNRRYAPATLDNIVRELKAQPEHRDFTWQDMYFFHDVARELVKRFKSVKEIKKAAKEQLVDYNEITEKMNELASDYNALAEEIKKDPDNHNPEISLSYALIEGKGSMAERLEEVGLNSDEESVKKVEDIVKRIKALPTRYFEAKVRRGVRFNEFSAVFVPAKKSYDTAAEDLLGYGANVIRYSNDEELKNLFEALKQQENDFMFQKKQVANAWYDPDLQIIALTKNWNKLSLVHEMHHHYLDKLINAYNQAENGLLQMTDAGKQEIKNLLDMLDITDPMHLTAEELTIAQERFAAMTEAYLSGLGVQENQNQVYKDFLAWVPEKYKSIANIGYLNEKNEIVNPLLDQDAIDFFNKWFSEPQMPALPTSPDSQSMINPMDDKDEIIPSSQKEMNDREIKWGIDSAEQIEADKKLYNAIDEDTPSDLRAAIDGAKVELRNMPTEDNVSMPVVKRERWFKPGVENAQERMADMAREYVEKNKEHATELALADPEISAVYDAPVDRAWLIRAVMEITDKGSEEYAIMYDNLATYRSMSGSTLGLTNDISQEAYLEAKREIESSREMKAVINYAGNSRGAWGKWSGDIKAFINARVGKVLATEAGTQERKVAVQAFIEEAKTKFSGNTENAILNQLDLTGINARSQAAFIKWAEKAIKQAVGVGLTNEQQKKLMDASVKAQKAMLAIDNTNSAISSAAARDIRNWQVLKDELKKANFGRFDKFNNAVNNAMGGYVPSAMLMSINTLFVANIPSTAINNAIIKSSMEAIYKEQLVPKSVLKAEEDRIRNVYKASGMNLAQMEKPTSPSLMHGEKYMGQEKSKWYDFTFKVLSWGDNLFRIPTFVETLGRIASKNANGNAKLAEEKFKLYSQLNTTDEEAKLARKQALAVSNMAVFTQDGILATGLNHVRDSINKMSRGLLGLDKEGFGLGNLLAPFLKTGANVVEMGITGSIAPIRQIAFILKRLNGKEIPEIQRIALRSDWKVFAFTALSVALLSALTSDDDELYIDPYEPGKRYDPNRPYDSINIGGAWVKLDTFGVFSVPVRVAVKLVKGKNLFSAYGFGLQEALGEIPLLNNLTTDPTYMFKQPGKWTQGFAYNTANKFVPAQAKSVIRAGSRATGAEFDPEFLGKYLQRRFHRNYGLDGLAPTTNDYINVLTNRLKFIE